MVFILTFSVLLAGPHFCLPSHRRSQNLSLLARSCPAPLLTVGRHTLHLWAPPQLSRTSWPPPPSPTAPSPLLPLLPAQASPVLKMAAFLSPSLYWYMFIIYSLLNSKKMTQACKTSTELTQTPQSLPSHLHHHSQEAAAADS